MTRQVCVTGAGGFIGSHLVKFLKREGYWVRAVDIKEPQWSESPADEKWFNWDLRNLANARQAIAGCDEVYALAATMGGAGFVFTGDHDCEIMFDNTLINLNTLQGALESGVGRYLFTSSACAYPERLQEATDSAPLKESDAYPAGPDSEYGWEKLYTERLCGAYARASDMQVRIARFHNVFGPYGSYNDGREKLPAAACRKVAVAALTGNHQVEVWGDGLATRSFCYIDDCLEMLYRLMHSDYEGPMNIGTDRSVSVNEVFEIVADIAGVDVELVHIPGPQGVRGRNADLTLMRNVLDYEPQVSLEVGLACTYGWIHGKMRELA